MISATNILLLQTGCCQASHLVLICLLVNTIKIVLLSIVFVFLPYVDDFVVFKGVALCDTLVVASTFVCVQEKLAPHELVCGLGVVVGNLMIHLPQQFLPTDVGEEAADIPIEATDTSTTCMVGMILVVVSGEWSNVIGLGNTGPNVIGNRWSA